ncbi:MAG TPA: hypothetical protein VI934_03765 [Candidatus Nanoarchaeia archaeon]|nr:hypothetical protein [Candidatus Nanoarchaeia archaeon]
MNAVLPVIFFIIGSTLAAAHFSDTPGVVAIHMNESGFYPSIISISKESVIIFENTGLEEHWPASNMHPTHQIYPEFDPRKPVAPGKSWSFSFGNSGSWRFHDHLFPEFSGVVSVVDGSGKVNTSARILEAAMNPKSFKMRLTKVYYSIFSAELNDKFANVNMLKAAMDRKSLSYWLILVGPERVMAKIVRDSGQGSVFDCHQQAHEIGMASYALYSEKSFGKGDFSCHSGYYHGAMEALLVEKGTQNISSTLGKICLTFPTNSGIFECIHGIGHGGLAYENYNLPKALALCGELGSDDATHSCYGGVFMENIITGMGLGAVRSHSTKWLSNDPYFPCSLFSSNDTVNSSIEMQCYFMQTSWMLWLSGYNFSRVAEQCRNSPKDIVEVCFQSFGRDIAGFTLRDSKRIVEGCSIVPREGQNYERCIVGALYVIVDFFGPALRSQGSGLCALVTEPAKKECYAALNARLKHVFGSDNKTKQVVCGTFEKEYQYLCS